MPLWGKLVLQRMFQCGQPDQGIQHTYLFGAPCHHEGHVPISVALLALRGAAMVPGSLGASGRIIFLLAEVGVSRLGPHNSYPDITIPLLPMLYCPSSLFLPCFQEMTQRNSRTIYAKRPGELGGEGKKR